ncbi:hypothetical protein ES702_00761 [subsurface metagenome]
MGEDEERVEEAPPPPVVEKKKTALTELISTLRKGKGGIDPMVFMLVSSELRRQEREDRRADREDDEWKERKSGSHDSNQQKPVDVEAILAKMDEKLEKHREQIERMFLGKKLEDTEERAKVAEKKLEEKEEKEEQEKLVEERVGPLEEEIGNLRVALAHKTEGMTNEQKKDVFADIGEKIREKIGGSVGDKIANTITESLDEAFSPKDDETIATTKEGKVDYAKETFKSINKGLGVLAKYIEKMPAGPPEVKEVKKMPDVEKPSLTPEQQRILDKVKRGEELVPPPAPPAPAEVKEEEKAPPPKKPPEKPKEKPVLPEEKKPPIKPKEEGVPPLGPPLPKKFEPKTPPKTEEKKKPIKPAKPTPKKETKPKVVKKPVIKKKEKGKGTHSKPSEETTTKGSDNQTP